jgi:ribosomal protein L16/L10AE
VVRVGTSKGSTISHMAAVHPGHYLLGALQKEEEEEYIMWLLS